MGSTYSSEANCKYPGPRSRRVLGFEEVGSPTQKHSEGFQVLRSTAEGLPCQGAPYTCLPLVILYATWLLGAFMGSRHLGRHISEPCIKRHTESEFGLGLAETAAAAFAQASNGLLPGRGPGRQKLLWRRHCPRCAALPCCFTGSSSLTCCLSRGDVATGMVLSVQHQKKAMVSSTPASQEWRT